MAIIDRGSRLTYARLKAQFDAIAKIVQYKAGVNGDDFTSLITTGYGANTALKSVDLMIDGTTTGLKGFVSVSGMAAAAGVLDSLRRKASLATNSLTTAEMVDWGLGSYIQNLMAAFSVGYDTTYDNFWTAFAALYTATEYVMGEVVDIMDAVGIKPDPAYCHPPLEKWLATILYTDAATATLTQREDIDPLLYRNHTTEWYVAVRAGTPDEAAGTIADASDQDDSPTDTGASDFTFTVATGSGSGGTVGDTGDLAQADSNQMTSVKDSTLTSLTGGKVTDQFEIRVKALRSAGDCS